VCLTRASVDGLFISLAYRNWTEPAISLFVTATQWQLFIWHAKEIAGSLSFGLEELGVSGRENQRDMLDQPLVCRREKKAVSRILTLN
jgi:hypothetical protein